jgi:hypothetical protein
MPLCPKKNCSYVFGLGAFSSLSSLSFTTHALHIAESAMLLFFTTQRLQRTKITTSIDPGTDLSLRDAAGHQRNAMLDGRPAHRLACVSIWDVLQHLEEKKRNINFVNQE